MTKLKNMNKLIESGLVAVIRRPNKEQVHSIAEALIDGGVGALEITVDTPGVLDIIEELKATYSERVLVGAGTVLDAETAKKAIDAGADFIFSPSFDKETVEMTNRYGRISIPGVMTPTEMVLAYQAGADILKVFPADALGIDYIKNVQGPLSHIPMMPTGGVSIDNVGAFIKNGAVAVGVGGTLVDRKAIEEKNYGELTRKAREFSQAIQRARREGDVYI